MRHVEVRMESRHDVGPCWMWTGTRVGEGRRYGQFRPTSRMKDPKCYAHRFAYEMVHGEIPKGLEVDHICEVTLCVNPDHLEAVTPRENMDRMRARMTVCRAGLHDMRDPTNITIIGGTRACRGCIRIREQRRNGTRRRR